MNMTNIEHVQVLDETRVESKEEYKNYGLPFRVYQPPTSKIEEQLETKILNWNGIIRVKNKPFIKRMYRFYLCQFEVLSVYQAGNALNNNKPWISNHSTPKQNWIKVENISLKEIDKAKNIAIRSLYVLGDDLGIVDVAICRSSPKYRISKISSFRAATPQMNETVKYKINSTYHRATHPQSSNAVIGADLEFVLRHNNGKYVLASKYFNRNGKVGHDAIWLRGKRNKYPLGELRPAPSTSPKTVFRNLYQCIRTAVRKINNVHIEWLAGGLPLPSYPIGGHIHFSQVKLDSYLIRALDNYLTLPLFLLESEISLKRRPKYGFIGDYRVQFHGGFEYRTPPSWIVTPTVAKGVLCLAKVIANDYQELNWMPLNRFEVQEAFYEGKQDQLYPIVHVLWSELQHCASYEKYKDELDAFYLLIQEGYQWNEYDDIRMAWKLPPYSS